MTTAVYGVIFFVLIVFQRVANTSHFFTQEVKNFFVSFYTFTEFFFFSLFFYFNIKNRLFKLALIVIFALFVCFQVIFYLNVQVKELDNVPVGIETVIIFIYIFYFFYEYFVTINHEYVYDNYCFWISIGLMIYLGSSFFVFILADHITSDEDHAKFWSLSWIMETVKNILFVVAIVVETRQRSKQKIPNQNLPFLDFT